MILNVIIDMMWMSISCKLNLPISDSKNVINQLHSKLNSGTLNLNDYDNTTIDAYQFYLDTKKQLKFD